MNHKIYLDTEFNAFGGELISLGMCSTDGGEVYVEFPITRKMSGYVTAKGRMVHPWVAENVLPHLEGTDYPPIMSKQTISNWLSERQQQEIIADWPADFEHLMACIYEDNGMRPNLQLTMRLIDVAGASELSEVPHHALHDARALMKAHQKYLKEQQVQ